jgi:hypothetical protein
MKSKNTINPTPVEIEKFEALRKQFRILTLSNPNYFGNIKDSPLKPVLNIQHNNYYEDIGCVGLQPQFDRLDAVVYVKQSSGYSGGICSEGSQEYVRFYMSFDNGATWEDMGITSFTAYDIPGTTGENRLEYAVSLLIKPAHKFCIFTNRALVRAILSWNVPPPANTPNFPPVWGDVHNTHVLIEPFKFNLEFQVPTLSDLLKTLKAKVPAELTASIDLAQPISIKEQNALSIAELKQLYQGKVEPHRFALSEIHKLVSHPLLSEATLTPHAKGILADLGIDISGLFEKFFPTDGNTNYEELECIGFNPVSEELVGTIRVKLPNGYSGSSCTAGSREYVTFWADFDNTGTFETCLGTTSVNVYDIADIPKEGLEYSVFLPIKQFLNKFRKPCGKGPVLVRIRAILSWQKPAPCANPNYIPVWGNREETLIHVKPGQIIPSNTHPPIIETVGSMSITKINSIGLANGTADLVGFSAIDSPFGGIVVITGHIANSTDISAGAAALKYRVQVSNDNGVTWQNLNNSFDVSRTQLLDGSWSFLPSITQSVDADNYYTYREDLVGSSGNAQIFVSGNVLGRWNTGGLNGLWKIRIEVKDAANTIFVSSPINIQLDNVPPTAEINITSGGGACADFVSGTQISGTYAATDVHFGTVSISVEPVPDPPASPGTFKLDGIATSSRSYPVLPTTGNPAGTWSLDTTGMPKCGYVIRLHVWDRTIVNSGWVGFYNSDVVGLCLRT